MPQTRGRHSAAALSVTPNGPREPPLQPPAYFNAREVAEWRAIVDRLGDEYFPRESRALLANYVSISCQLSDLGAELSKFKEVPCEPTRRAYWATLTRGRGPLVLQLANLAAKLRLAPSSRNDRDRTTHRAGQSGWCKALGIWDCQLGQWSKRGGPRRATRPGMNQQKAHFLTPWGLPQCPSTPKA